MIRQMKQLVDRDLQTILDRAHNERKASVMTMTPELPIDVIESALDEPAPPKKWTVLAYLDGDNNLERFALNSLLQMEKVGSNNDVNVVAQLDRMGIPKELRETQEAYEKEPARYDEAYKRYEENPEKYEDDYQLFLKYQTFKRLDAVTPRVDGQWSGARRYFVVKGSNDPVDVSFKQTDKGETYTVVDFKTDKIASPCLIDLGNVPMSSKDSLRDFLAWGMRKYPAEHYLLVAMDHGFGYMGSMIDETDRSAMPLPHMREAVEEAEKETGKKLDIIGFDACLMGMAETAYEFKDVTDFTVASQQVEMAPGWPVAEILQKLEEGSSSETMNPRDVARMIVDEARKTPVAMPTLSAVDSSRMGEVKAAMDTLGEHLSDPSASVYDTKNALRKAKGYGFPLNRPSGDYRDIVDMADHIATQPKVATETVKIDLERLRNAVKEAVIAEEHSDVEDGSHGLSVYAPVSVMRYDPFRYNNPVSNLSDSDESFSYRKVAMTQDSGWEKMLRVKFK
ncbi:MAG: clostripain-related cysteine peptidase [Candidatus Xenobiia bacterium LiM19]